MELQGAEWAEVGVEDNWGMAGGGAIRSCGDERGEAVLADEVVEDIQPRFVEGGRNVHRE